VNRHPEGVDIADAVNFPRGGAYAMGGPPRPRVASRLVAVSGRVVTFSTAIACIYHGLLRAPERRAATTEAEALWGGDVARFLAVVRKKHLRGSPAERTLATWPGPVIGWAPQHPTPQDGWLTVVCTDLAWTLAVLGRVEGTLLLPQRRARLTWEHLFGIPFALDDSRLAAVAAVTRDQIGPIAPAGTKP